MSCYFITASGTGIGKTFVTAALTAQLRAQGREVRALKPVISGFTVQDAAQSDSGILLRAQGMEVTGESLDAVSPWRFAAPLSPDMAAAEEGRSIDFGELLAFCRPPQDGVTLIEGVGGVMSPVTARHTVLDWMAQLGHRVILVGGSYLGSISHTLTAAHAVLAQGLTIAAVIVSESQAPQVGLQRTAESVSRFLPQGMPLAVLPRTEHLAYGGGLSYQWEGLPDITRLLL